MVRRSRSGFTCRSTLLAICMALGSASGLAQVTTEGGTEEPAPLDEYRVELIVFENAGLVGTGEDWRPREERVQEPVDETGPGVAAGAAVAAAPRPLSEDALSADESSADRLAFRYMPLTSANLELNDVVSRLRSSADYELLLHVAWQQPGFDQETTRPLDLERVGALPERLAGEATLYRSRFLHLMLDLRLRAKGAEGLGIRSFTEDSVAALEPVVYRLQESRKLRSGELHYFDHPRFGALALVTPVSPPQPPAPRETMGGQ